MKSILKLFEELGFTPSVPPASWTPDEVKKSEALLTGIHVFGKAEPWDAGKDHFCPFKRGVHVLGPNGGTPDNPTFYYVTSYIYGSMRRYRGRSWNNVEVCNVFASGPTQLKAVENWIEKWKQHMDSVDDPTCLSELCSETGTCESDWKEFAGVPTGVGLEYFYRHKKDGREAYCVDDMGDISVNVSE